MLARSSSLGIAWRINRLMRLGRQLPDLPAELFLEEIEWQAAFILNRKKPPAKPPSRVCPWPSAKEP
jgi:hypothetical protein